MGSLLDTDSDIRRRKSLTIDAMNKLKEVWTSTIVTLNVKLRLFNTCIRSIFLYNSQIWTMTKKRENQVDYFHRRMLRKMLGVRWPKKISNIELQKKTTQKPWHFIISEQRLRWLSDAIRLP